MRYKHLFSPAAAAVVLIFLNASVFARPLDSVTNFPNKKHLGINLGLNSRIWVQTSFQSILSYESSISKNLYLTMSTGYHGYRVQDHTCIEYVKTEDGILTKISENKISGYFRHAIPVVLGLKYFTPAFRSIYPFISVNYGLYNFLNSQQDTSLEYETVYRADGSIVGQKKQYEEKTGNTLAVGLGFQFKFGSGFLLFHVQHIDNTFMNKHVRFNTGYIIAI